ncbi:MAG: hypothetical protein GC136_05105 [Alphaproteobacteria bacterium]|nr:hypothetical protein [Alphaproteobacteria bacterium]
MNLKSYLQTRAPVFTESEIAPIHLADLNGRHYYAFAADVKPPSGGKSVSDEELEAVITYSHVIRQIKEEAGRRILQVAPLWKQQNACVDLYLLGDRTDLTDGEQEALTKAQDLLAQVQVLRERSDTIEASFLNGVAVDYLTDKAWEDDVHAE